MELDEETVLLRRFARTTSMTTEWGKEESVEVERML